MSTTVGKMIPKAFQGSKVTNWIVNRSTVLMNCTQTERGKKGLYTTKLGQQKCRRLSVIVI